MKEEVTDKFGSAVGTTGLRGGAGVSEGEEKGLRGVLIVTDVGLTSDIQTRRSHLPFQGLPVLVCDVNCLTTFVVLLGSRYKVLLLLVDRVSKAVVRRPLRGNT